MIILGIGSNIGNKTNNIREAIFRIEGIHPIKSISRLYYSYPVDYLKQDHFINCAVSIDSNNISPFLLLEQLKKIEDEFGRKKIIDKGPRIIDIDIIFYGNSTLNGKDLTIPHPSWSKRPFVYLPVLEIYNEINTKVKVEFSSNDCFPLGFL